MTTFSPLRLAGGTLRIKLTANNADDLILDRNVVAANCPALAPLLRAPNESGYCAAWDKSRPVKVPGQEDEARVFTLALKKINGTMLLEGQEYDAGDEEEGHFSFLDSEYAGDGWPGACWASLLPCASGVEEAAENHSIMFEIVHGCKLSSTRLSLPLGADHTSFLSWSYHKVSSVCALAQFYGCMPIVAKEVCRVIETCPTLWEAIALDPNLWLKLSIKLRWSEVYFDALRHVLSRIGIESVHDPRVRAAAETLEVEPSLLIEWSKNVLLTQSATILRLNHGLQRLQLGDSYEEYNKQKKTVRGVTFLNLLRNAWPGRSSKQKSMEKAEFIARATYGQWLAEQNGGKHIYVSARRKYGMSGPLSVTLARLEKAAASGNPPALFGSNVPQNLAAIFFRDCKSISAKQIDTVLAGIVEEADEIVKEAFAPYEEEFDGGVLTFRRCNFNERVRTDYNGNTGQFTFLGLDESDTPWAGLKEWEVDEVAMPASMDVANEAYVAAIQEA